MVEYDQLKHSMNSHPLVLGLIIVKVLSIKLKRLVAVGLL